MHPRNIYKHPPNFKELAISYPNFRKYVKQELTGKVSIDFQDRKAVAELTKTLLLKDFNLDVEIDESRLIPRIPLCLNYVLWIEDLLSVLNINDRKPCGIDIGTGSVCIYCLLASSKGWKMLGTEADENNITLARKNLAKNNLENQITIVPVKNFNELLLGVINEEETYDFCMSNPPFFNPNEKPVKRTPRRKEILSIASDVSTEIATHGGEVEFIKKLIKESEVLKDKIRIYTTLVGKKSDLLVLEDEVKKSSAKTFTVTEFCQGKTMRWGIAWSFLDVTLGKSVSKEQGKAKGGKNKSKNVLRHAFINTEGVDAVAAKIKTLMGDLKLDFTEESTDQATVAFKVAAYENTWSHQRRKRRENKLMEEGMDAKSEETADSSPPTKKLKTDEETSAEKNKIAIVEFLIMISDEGGLVVLEFPWLAGNKELIHQILTYFKNHGIEGK